MESIESSTMYFSDTETATEAAEDLTLFGFVVSWGFDGSCITLTVERL